MNYYSFWLILGTFGAIGVGYALFGDGMGALVGMWGFWAGTLIPTSPDDPNVVLYGYMTSDGRMLAEMENYTDASK